MKYSHPHNDNCSFSKSRWHLGSKEQKKNIFLTNREASEDGFKILVTKGFVIVFESGIIVITHWKRNNYIQKDRYKETIYKDEKSYLNISNNNLYEKKERICI